MQISELMIPEFEREAAMTRSLLARVPSDKLAWTPGSGLKSIGWNAQHLAEIVGWAPMIVGQDELDLAPPGGPAYTPPPPATDVGQILKVFDENLPKSVAALRGVPDAVMDQPWTMKMGGHTIFTMKKGDCLRKWMFAHAAHHRGILSVYLRMAGVKIGSIYEE
ncbi:MAG TPA: DinB family protein [Humisphaera sp.]